jgi:hypothetical protein
MEFAVGCSITPRVPCAARALQLHPTILTSTLTSTLNNDSYIARYNAPWTMYARIGADREQKGWACELRSWTDDVNHSADRVICNSIVHSGDKKAKRSEYRDYKNLYRDNAEKALVAISGHINDDALQKKANKVSNAELRRAAAEKTLREQVEQLQTHKKEQPQRQPQRRDPTNMFSVLAAAHSQSVFRTVTPARTRGGEKRKESIAISANHEQPLRRVDLFTFLKKKKTKKRGSKR